MKRYANPCPFDNRLMELQLLNRPEDKEELAFLEEYVAWRAAGGLHAFEAKRMAEHKSHAANLDRLLRWTTKQKAI